MVFAISLELRILLYFYSLVSFVVSCKTKKIMSISYKMFYRLSIYAWRNHYEDLHNDNSNASASNSAKPSAATGYLSDNMQPQVYYHV